MRIGTLPGAGTLANNGVAVSAGQSIMLADINAGKLVFTPMANANGAGYASFTFQLQDDGGSANGGLDLDPTPRTMGINVTAVNDAPTVAAPLPNQGATDGSSFNYSIAAGSFADVDVGDTLSYSAMLVNGAALPAWLSFDNVTRTFSGAPASADVGVIDIRAAVTDVAGASAFQDFTLTVANVNRAPAIAAPIPDQGASEDAAFSYTFAAGTFSDVDAGDILSYGARLSSGALLPAWLGFDAATRTFSGTPANADVGTLSVRVTATDLAGAAIFDDFMLTVANTNDAPVATAPIAGQTAVADAPVRFELTTTHFSDPDVGDILRYAATLADGSALPDWLAFDAGTLVFTGTPNASDAGRIAVRVTATDLAGASAQALLAITVSVPNQPFAVEPAAPESNVAPVSSGVSPDVGAQTQVKPALAQAALARQLDAPMPPPHAALVLDAQPTSTAPSSPLEALRGVTDADPSQATRVFGANDTVVAPALLPQLTDTSTLQLTQLTQLLRSDELMRKFEELQRHMIEQGEQRRTVIGSSIIMTSGLSIGYVIWLVRGGVLVSSMLSALPAWQMIDPLPVLAAARTG